MSEQLFEIIHERTAARPIPLKHLADQTGIPERKCKALIQELRRAGKPIGEKRGKPNGYYFALTESEVFEASEKLRHEGLTRLVTAAMMRKRPDIAAKARQLSLDLGETPLVRVQLRHNRFGHRLCSLDTCSNIIGLGAKFCSDAHRAEYQRKAKESFNDAA